MSTLFISDLHLSKENAAAGELFLRFLEQRAPATEALYILGDLFEVWLGDDLILPEYQAYLAALKSVTGKGLPIYVMHGNRDFLLGEQFEQISGCRLLEDPSVVNLYGTPSLLMHGDLLCTDDISYQQLRRMLRDPQWIETFLGKTPEERIDLAKQLREKSREQTGQKAAYIMDVNPQAVADAFRQHDVKRIIHGHTHRQGTHQTDTGERLVLGDWNETGSVLVCNVEGCSLEVFK